MEERRRALRLQYILDGAFSKGNIWSRNKSLIIKDISTKGISFISHSSLSKGEVLDLEIKLDTLTVHCNGEVVRVNVIALDRLKKQIRFEVGIKFLDLSKEDTKKIDCFVKNKTKG